MKERFLNKLKELDKLELNKKSYAITGSGPLAIRGMRQADDIDVLVKQSLWKKLLKTYQSHDGKHIRIGVIEIWSDFLNLTPILTKVIDGAQIIEGYPFVSLEYTLLWKRYLNREKDQKDIRLIEEFGKSQKNINKAWQIF